MTPCQIPSLGWLGFVRCDLEFPRWPSRICSQMMVSLLVMNTVEIKNSPTQQNPRNLELLIDPLPSKMVNFGNQFYKKSHVPVSKHLMLVMVIDHPLLHGNNGSLDPSTYRIKGYKRMERSHSNPQPPKPTFRIFHSRLDVEWLDPRFDLLHAWLLVDTNLDLDHHDVDLRSPRQVSERQGIFRKADVFLSQTLSVFT